MQDQTATQQIEEDNPKPLWRPSGDKTSMLERFIEFAQERTGQSFSDYESLHEWSAQDSTNFWNALWDFAEVIGDKGDIVIEDINNAPWARFFTDSKINYAENMLAQAQETPDEPAIIARRQGEADQIISWQDLYDQVSLWVQALSDAGLKEGDRIGAYLPNIPETVIILMAASNLGIVFSSAGMEMGPDDLINRFNQVKPKMLITADGYIHGEKSIVRTDVLQRAQAEIGSITHMVVVPVISEAPDLSALKSSVSVQNFLAPFAPGKINFPRRDFNHPLYILFSSGTTGKPKCFEHSTGGVLLKHLSEYLLHCDVRPGDKVFYHATPSWMMWNWLASGLAAKAAILMYDGSPAYPDAYAQWNFTSGNGCSHHGTAAPVILSWANAEIDPRKACDLSKLRMVMSTGAVLPASGFEYIHEHIKSDVKIGSISGGTDIVGCFVGGNALSSTYAGQINGPLLGMNVQVWDESGQPVPAGQAGEMVCTNPFPSMPLRFLDDPKGERYMAEYFETYPGRKVWRHGDSIEKTPQGQFKILGRSDATLNQNGVRIGAGAIYKQLEPFQDQIKAAAAVDFTRPDNEQAITVLFLAIDGELESVPEDLAKAIKKNVKDNVTPYAIPTEMIAVPDVLKTPNGKTAEVVMKKIINGKTIPNPSLYGEELVQNFEKIGQNLKEKYGA